ncbi:MAG: aminopeptidase P family protein [Alphaproteobacteria bacterium]|nr:aminopeptidase P family protein [Alphaproteobacteria bacterium]
MTLLDLQKKLKKAKYDGFLISRNNLFLEQDIRDDENIIQQLTDFTGSAGTILITEDKNYLFVDGRYELQAPAQTQKHAIEVICTTHISIQNWLQQHMSGKKIGYNPWCWSITEIAHFSTLKMIADADFVPTMLSSETPTIYAYDLAYCGQSREEKVVSFAQYIKDQGFDAFFISSADSISWLLNLRSDALSNTPVFRAMALIDTHCHVWIFSVPHKNKDEKINLPFLSLDDLPDRFKKFRKKTIGADYSNTSSAIYTLAEEYHIQLINKPDILQQQKAIKNICELKNIRTAHLYDGIALCKFLYWLDNNWQGKTELDIVEKLHEFRTKQPHFVSESFATIAAAGSNGAIVHYAPSSKTNKKLEANTLLLLDSGAQYLEGTTDITRTIPLGVIPPQMCEDYTLVLKSHIALSKTVFPQNTTGARLDAIARQPLWQEGKNYNHGTGHGVGCFLNVHEGPQYISASCSLPFSSRQITSIEPGYYLENQYGIRIENLVEICPAQYKGFLKFKNLTLVPIDLRAINKYLLSAEEISWLNTYHQEVFATISPHLTSPEKEWLKTACAPL